MHRSNEKIELFGVAPYIALCWLFVCLGVAVVLVPHLELWPRITQDEVQIIDMGRVVLDPSTDWSTGWLVEEDRARLDASYLGVTLQELTYRISAPSSFGSRLFALIGALLAATMVLLWLLARHTPPLAAIVLAAVFLLDPIFNESYRQGRVDSWAFAFVIAACWLLQLARSRDQSRNGIGNRWLVFTAGCLIGASPFVWLTAIALGPLVLLEIAYLLEARWKAATESRLSCIRSLMFWFVSGGLLSLVVLMIPILVNWDAYVASTEVNVLVQKTASVIRRNIFDMYLLYDPLLIPAVFVSLLIKREPGLLIATSLALAMMYMTMVYPMRILYLLPYLVGIVGSACAAIAARGNRPRRRTALICVVAVLLLWNSVVTLLNRPLIAHHQQAARSQEQIQLALGQVIGEGPFSVLLEEWELYFAARSFGWKVIKIFGRFPKDQSGLNRLLEDVDYVIQRNKYQFMRLSHEKLEAAGFRLLTTVSFPLPPSTDLSLGPVTIRTPDVIYEDVMVYKKYLDAESP